MGNIKLIKFLIKHGAQIDHNDSFGKRTPLHEAIQYKQWDIALCLVKNFGANIHILDKKGKTALDYIEDVVLRDKLQLEFQQYEMRFCEKNPTSLLDDTLLMFASIIIEFSKIKKQGKRFS